MVRERIHEKRVELEQKGASPHQDLITCMLSNHNENNEEAVTEKEIVDNVILVMVAGHETSAVLITFIMRLLANEPALCSCSSRYIHIRLYLNAEMKINLEEVTWRKLSN